MSHNLNQDPVTGSIKQSWGMVVVGAFGFFGILMFMAIFLPNYSGFYVSVVMPIGFVGIVSFFWINAKPNLWAKLLGFVSISGLFMVIAIRAFSYILPEISSAITILIVISTVLAHLLPVLSLVATSFIRRELSFTPQTQVGKILLKISLALLPVGGFLGAGIGLFTHGKNQNINYILLLLGPICWLLAIILPFSTAYPISPWEYERNKK